VEESTVVFSRSGAIARITLNRPDKRNALTQAMMSRMLSAFDEFESDDDVRVLAILGAGTAFCSGVDLDDMLATRERQGWFEYELLPEVFARLARHPNPTVAIVQGPAVAGGCELALHCDVRIGSPAARFAMPLARLGLVAPCYATGRLVNTAGFTAARDMLLTGDAIGGERAERVGILSRLESADELSRSAEQLLQRLAANAPLSMRAMKRVLNRLTPQLSEQETAAFEAERVEISRSRDMQEGLQAFLQRRPATFRGV
jgi:enoyl-CoA hydratase/carnithine racemase